MNEEDTNMLNSVGARVMMAALSVVLSPFVADAQPVASAPLDTTAGKPAAAITSDLPGGNTLTSTKCELHIWPAERFSAMTTGLLGGGLLDYAAHAKGDAERKSHMASALDSPGQVAALAALDLPTLLKQEPATIVRHEVPLTRHTVNDIKTRRAESTSPCYSELIFADIFYQKAAIYGRSLKALFIYREFAGASPTTTRIYKSWGGNGLKLFPPKPGEDIEAADAELVNVFKADFQEFARSEVTARTAAR